jgi:hypothetical protein
LQESKIQFLSQRVSDLELQVAMTQIKQQTHLEKVLPTMKSVKEAFVYFKSMYPELNVEVLSRAEKGAKDSVYENTLQVFKALEWIGTIYLNSRSGKISVDLAKSCQEQTGMQYKQNQSESTMGMYANEYYADWKGKKVALKEHLLQGSSRDARQTIRIAFAFDKATDTVIIGYVGQHQTTRNS